MFGFLKRWFQPAQPAPRPQTVNVKAKDLPAEVKEKIAAWRKSRQAPILPFIEAPRPKYFTRENAPAITPDADGWTRHLIYYCYPVAGNGCWQRNMDWLKSRLALFNGRRVVAIAASNGKHELDSPETVMDYLGRDAADYLVVQHRGNLGEVCAFVPLWQRLRAHHGERDVTFYGHTKGVTQSADRYPVHRWAWMMYAANLDHWPKVASLLAKHSIVGAFRSVSFNRFHYAGTFYWCRNRDVFARQWRRVPQMYGGTEMWPGMMFRPWESACIFYDKLVGVPLYSHQGIADAEAKFTFWRHSQQTAALQ